MVEFLSPNQLKKYEGIIDQINCEFEKHEILKTELARENDNLIFCQLANSSLTRKISHINVLVFYSLTDLLNLYEDVLDSHVTDLLKFSNCKFYFIQVYVTKSLFEKAEGLCCKLHTSIKSRNVSFNKTLPLSKNNPITAVIPVDKCVINCVAEVSLVCPSKGTYAVVNLDTVNINISCHFQIYKEKQKGKYVKANIAQITRLYHKSLTNRELIKSLMLEYKLCDIDMDLLVTALIRNCYHSLDIEVFNELKKGIRKDFILKLSTGGNSFELIYNLREKYLKLRAPIEYMYFLKTFFYEEFYKNLEINSDLFSEQLTRLKANEDISQTTQEVCSLFHEVRGAWSKLPI